MVKFDYDEMAERSEPVAYIDRDGDLVVLDNEGEGVCWFSDSNKIIKGCVWGPFAEGVKHVFYPGDKLTITF